MDARDLKRILAGIAVSGLLAGPALLIGGSTGTANAEEKKVEQAPASSESGKSGTDNVATTAPTTQKKPEQPAGKSG